MPLSNKGVDNKKYTERKKQTNRQTSSLLELDFIFYLFFFFFLRRETFLKLKHFSQLFDHLQIPKMSPKKWRLFAQYCMEKNKANNKKALYSDHTSVIRLFSSKMLNTLLPRDGYQLKCPINQGFTNHPNPMATFRCLLVNVPERGKAFRVLPST